MRKESFATWWDHGKCHLMTSYLAYLAFGLAHEVAHVVAAFAVDCHHGMLAEGETYVSFFIRITLGRAVQLPATAGDEGMESLVRQAGWMVSVLAALIVVLFAKNIPRTIQNAAYITAVEAIASDLFGFGCISHGTGTFLCGNFGLIIVNPAWINGPGSDNGKEALKIVKKLVEVTMMRGAQSGGVVCWTKGTNVDGYRGIRSRVVNAKRTDLSRRIYKKVLTDAFSKGRLKSGIRGFFGHTRFATSSKATFEGTHPHQWSHSRLWRVFGKDQRFKSKPKATHVIVENYVTHNGDFDFFRVGEKFYDLQAVQEWLVRASGWFPVPTPVDSAAIAGVVDLLRTAGSMGLSVRYALLVGCKSCTVNADIYPPSLSQYEKWGRIFEDALLKVCSDREVTFDEISSKPELRRAVGAKVKADVQWLTETNETFARFVSLDKEEEPGSSRGIVVSEFIRVTIDAFFDNDLFQTTKAVLENAKGSFGLMITSSLDASRQICIAARGQPMCVALYPRKGLVCYGSEQAALKAAIQFDTPGGDLPPFEIHDGDKFENESVRIDLDDLGGEICLIDWGNDDATILSRPNRHLIVHGAMHNKVKLVFHQESKTMFGDIHKRFTLLEGNELIKPLPDDSNDIILKDIRDIPRVCDEIQNNWKSPSLNSLTLFHFIRCLRSRLQARVSGKVPVHAGTVDILLTGCEVSLWLAEQFATDLQKCFPRLFVQACSSNKILGVFGQELAVPSVGYPMCQQTPDLSETIVIIVSHSGGTFAPLACSNLLQSKTKNIFVIASEWDTQIGKQLRTLSSPDELFSSRIFTTDIGVRPAEPCSLSVVATQQLLTQLFQDIATEILDNEDFRRISGAVITESDVKILERCNLENIRALETIVGASRNGGSVEMGIAKSEKLLRQAGKLWSDHVLENARALIMTFVYIVLTVTSGYPLVTGLAKAAGYDTGDWLYLTRFLDSLIYFFLPQINVIILRLVQGRNLRHRMVCRTVVIGDIPWVSQAADSFLSKIFACSYSIAGLNVLSGNPADHLVHRHTHRVVRGSLLLCGRPDGRLMGLTSAEATVCLSVNQASSILSIGGTCESITIGHNPSELVLTKTDIFLETHRPRFLCERMLQEEALKVKDASKIFHDFDDGGTTLKTSPYYLLGKYSGWKHEAYCSKHNIADSSTDHHSGVISMMIKDKSEHKRLKNIFDSIDTDGNGTLDVDEFVQAYLKVSSHFSQEDIIDLFHDIDVDGSGTIDFDEFARASGMPKAQILRSVERTSKRNLLSEASNESYFGQSARLRAPERAVDFSFCEAQNLSCELYEGRVASMQRFVAMTVMFHEMGMRVQRFFPRWSFGLLGYRMDRTHSILRIATTACPVSGSDLREQMEALKLMDTIQRAVNVISSHWYEYRRREAQSLLRAKSLGVLEVNERNQRLKNKDDSVRNTDEQKVRPRKERSESNGKSVLKVEQKIRNPLLEDPDNSTLEEQHKAQASTSKKTTIWSPDDDTTSMVTEYSC